MFKLALVALALTACSKKDKDTNKEPAPASTAQPKAAEPAKPPPPKQGLEDPTNEPKIAAAAKKVLAECGAKWTDKEASFGHDCEPMKEYRDLKLEEKEKANADATCLNLLSDADVKVRYLGATCLSSVGDKYRSDTALAARLIDALEREKAPSPIDMQLGYAALDVRESAGQNDRLVKLLEAPGTSTDVKLLLASWWRNKAAFSSVEKFAESDDPRLRLGGMQGYAIHFSDHAEAACDAWAKNVEHADAQVRKQAVGHLSGGWSGNNARDGESSWYVTGGGGGPSSRGDDWCPKLDGLLEAIDARIAKNELDDSVYIYALGNIAKHEKADPKHQKRAIDQLKKIVSTKGARERGFAAEKLLEADPKKMAGFLKPFTKDPDIGERVTRELEEAKKKK